MAASRILLFTVFILHLASTYAINHPTFLPGLRKTGLETNTGNPDSVWSTKWPAIADLEHPECPILSVDRVSHLSKNECKLRKKDGSFEGKDFW